MVAMLPLWERTEQALEAEKTKARGGVPVEVPASTSKVVLALPATTPVRTAVGGVGGIGVVGDDETDVCA
ncbi:MAG: hypothetical protein HOM55_01710 [Proteobacteria bacterium]|jgi:hypothetical protein|nr:hypothetical protein [Pseudomonadota bacterium]